MNSVVSAIVLIVVLYAITVISLVSCLIKKNSEIKKLDFELQLMWFELKAEKNHSKALAEDLRELKLKNKE